ncbi:VPS13D [Bugula neritina]|uniref:VPS13D n=1 Tax=Bugula neritina TaxID=10212 RepID=A0A7J7J6Y3_BUGNE|nr:VPS13D [Bugula neritina]
MSLEQLSVKFERATPYISTIGLQISSLSVLDLLQKEDSKHRYIVLSLDKSVDRGNVPKFISTSLPNTPVKNRKRKLVAENESHSLPSSSSTESLKKVCKKRKYSMSFLHNPNPPGENLVTVDITFIDRNIPDFSTAHNSVNTSIDIDFNCLEIVLNQETWVMLLDFFGLGAKVFTPEQQHEANTVLQTQPPTEGLKANLFVKSFSLVLVKKSYDLAKANISKFQIEVIKQQKTTKFSGGLGSLRVEDLSPHGVLHSCKFTTASDSSPDSFETNMKSALNFKFSSMMCLMRCWRESLTLQLTSTCLLLYTHTQNASLLR